MSSCSKIGKSCCLLCWRNSKNKQRSQWRKSRTLTWQHTHTHTHTRMGAYAQTPCLVFFWIYHMEYIIYVYIYIYQNSLTVSSAFKFWQYVLLFYISNISIFLIPDTHITSRDFAGFSNQCRSCKQRLMSNPPYKRCQQLKTRKSVKRAILRITWQHSQSIHQPLTPRLPFSLWRFTCVRCRHAFGI